MVAGDGGAADPHDAYVTALLRILTDTRPAGVDPADPYAQAADGIDRYDGFGREVVVTGLEVVDGPHGDDLEVTFALVGPPDGVPERGTTRAPFDRTWRGLSGYDDPAAYAPEVARRVMTGARRHVEVHRGEAGERAEADRRQVRAALPDRATRHRLLLDALAGQGEVTTVAPDRFEVRVRADGDDADAGPLGGAPAVLTFVVTAEQWEEILVSEGEDLALLVDEAVGDPDPDERFVVFHDGQLHRSTRVELPPVRGRARERALARLRAAGPSGGPAGGSTSGSRHGRSW